MKLRKIYQFLSSSLALALLTTGISVHATPRQTHWADSFVTQWEEDGVVTDTYFPNMDPEQWLTYGDMAILFRYYLGLEEETYHKTQEEDLQFDQESLRIMELLGYFPAVGLDEVVTREEGARLITLMEGWDFSYSEQYLNDMVELEFITLFSDHDLISPHCVHAVYTLLDFQLLTGCGGNRFEPQSPLTLGELSVIFSGISRNNLEMSPSISPVSSSIIPEYNDMENLQQVLGKVEEFVMFYSGEVTDEFLTLDKESGTFTVGNTSGEVTDFTQYLQWKLKNIPSLPLESEYFQDFNYNFTVETMDEYGFHALLTEEEDIAYLFALYTTEGSLVNEDTGIEAYLNSLEPTYLEQAGSILKETFDTTTANELVNATIITLSLKDYEKGMTVTWHTTEQGAQRVTTSEEGETPFLDQLLHLLPSDFPFAFSDWGKAQDIVLHIATSEEGIPYVYCHDESVAYRLKLPVIAEFGYDPQLVDPTPMDQDGETMYEYYALLQDLDYAQQLTETFLKIVHTQGLVEGDKGIWDVSEGTFLLDLQEESQDLLLPQEELYQPYSSSFPENLVLEVGRDEEDALFVFVNHDLISYHLGLPTSPDPESSITENPLPHLYTIPVAATPYDWEIASLNHDLTVANDIRKLIHIGLAMIPVEYSEEITFTITWDTSEGGTAADVLSVESTLEENATLLKEELLLTLGDTLLESYTTTGKETPFEVSVLFVAAGMPVLLCEEEFWALPLAMHSTYEEIYSNSFYYPTPVEETSSLEETMTTDSPLLENEEQ